MYYNLCYILQPSPIDPEVMTPLMSYIIYYGPPGTSSGGEERALSEVVPVAEGGVVSGYTVTGVTVGGEVKVGVAAVNSAGASQVAYYQHTVGERIFFSYKIIMLIKFMWTPII